MRLIPNSRGCWIMGVLNCTPDSFSDGGRFMSVETAVAHARQMIVDGVDIVDIGGESTRPGSLPVDPAEQIRRTIPVIERIRSFWDGPISIDTTKATVASAALSAGANWINDISALRDDAEMADIAAKSVSMVVLMHMQGTPRTMQTAPDYSDVVTEVRDFLQQRADFALRSGVRDDHIIVDPGIGFGKRQDDNLAILANLPRFAELGYPVLVGASRKSFIGKITGDDTPDRLEGSLAAAVWAALHGARIVRVHDVAATRKALLVAESIARGQVGRFSIR
ncbi:MAG: dihydropteroate synthase [candidate division Zixibacteria bacterium]|nr:dihydropteroate synthase [candidate division Zixibacteria bacterium]